MVDATTSCPEDDGKICSGTSRGSCQTCECICDRDLTVLSVIDPRLNRPGVSCAGGRGREGERERGREGGREGGREREGARERGREREGCEGGREREGGRGGGREEGRVA